MADNPPNKASAERRASVRAWVILSACIAAGVWIWLGFFDSDPLLEHHRAPRLARMLLAATRYGLPLGLIALALCFVSIRRRWIHPGLPILAVVAALLAGLLAFPLVEYAHRRSFHNAMGQVHPYLQLTPNAIAEAAGPEDATDVFCIGGSTTEFKHSDGRGWPRRAQELLQPDLPGEVRLHNHGRQWYTSLHSLINFETNLRHHQPEVVVVMHAVNDVIQNADFSYFSTGEFRPDYGHFHGPMARMNRDRGVLATTGDLLGRLWRHQPRREISPRALPGLASFVRYLDTLIELTDTDGATLVLMTQPSLYQPDMTESQIAVLDMLHREAVGPETKWDVSAARHAMLTYNDAIRDLAARRNVVLIDLEAAVPKDLEHFTDDVHYTDRTFDVIARAVAEGLRPVLRDTVPVPEQ